jgi:predicted DCC family thiol-disulfide oxidoreductase YuxK
MEKLYVLYDPKCELCCRLKNWILVQRSWIGLALVAQGSEKAKRLFPELDRIATREDLAVISDEGAVYLNDRAWIMVLYALVDYRDWAARLTHPLLMPLARQAFAALSKNRHLISGLLSADDPETLASELRQVELEPCELPAGSAGGAPAPEAAAPHSPAPHLSTVREYLQ